MKCPTYSASSQPGLPHCSTAVKKRTLIFLHLKNSTMQQCCITKPASKWGLVHCMGRRFRCILKQATQKRWAIISLCLLMMGIPVAPLHFHRAFLKADSVAWPLHRS